MDSKEGSIAKPEGSASKPRKMKQPQPNFKNQYSLGKTQITLDERKAQFQKVSEGHPKKIPVIVERAQNSSQVPEIDKNKFLVPAELTFAEFLYLIRKRIDLTNDQALFIYVNGTLPATSSTFGSVYEESKDEDGFLYVVYTGESTFGHGGVCGEPF